MDDVASTKSRPHRCMHTFKRSQRFALLRSKKAEPLLSPGLANGPLISDLVHRLELLQRKSSIKVLAKRFNVAGVEISGVDRAVMV